MRKKYNKSEILKKFINQFNSNLKNNNLPKYEEVAKVMLVCFAIEKSFKKNKEIKINYKKLNLEIMKYPFGKPILDSNLYLSSIKKF